MNIYFLVNEELKRLWAVWEQERNMFLRSQDHSGPSMHGVSRMHERNAHEVMAQIVKFREVILDQLKNHDQKIQERIAELALTGTPDVQKE